MPASRAQLLANILGTGVLFHTPLLREVVANDTRASLRVLQAAAAANETKRILVTTNAAQHFARAHSSSLPRNRAAAQRSQAAAAGRAAGTPILTVQAGAGTGRADLTPPHAVTSIGLSSAGLYEDRDESLPQCYCAPSAANSTDPRNDLLHAILEEEAPNVRMHDVYRCEAARGWWLVALIHSPLLASSLPLRTSANTTSRRLLTSRHPTTPRHPATSHHPATPPRRLFQPFWHMHVARTVSEHPRPNATRDAPACDCTHYCYLPEFWSGVYWPALLRAMS